MNFDNFNNSQRNSGTINFEDNDLLDDEWLYTSEPFDRTNTFRRKVKNEGETRNSVLEWLATDDDKLDSQDNSSVNLEDINKHRKNDSVTLFDNNSNTFNSDSLFDDDLDISNLDSKFMSNFKLVSQDDFEDTEIEESLTKTNTSPEIHRCDSPNTEINLETHKIGNNEIITVEDNDSDSNMTIINTTNKGKIDNLIEEDKKIEIINIDDSNSNENNATELNMTKSTLLKKSELAQKRFLAKVEEAKRTLENLKPRKDSLSSENELKIKTPKLEENENQDNDTKKEIHNKKKLERRSYYYYADTGSDDEKDDKNSSPKINSSNDNYSSSFKKTFNHFNSASADIALFNDNIYNTNENYQLPPLHNNRISVSDDFEDYPRKPPAPAPPSNSNLINNLMDHANFESQPAYQSDIDTESSSSLHSDHQFPEYYGNQHFSHYNPPPMNNMSFYSSSPNNKLSNLYIPSSPSLKSSSFLPSSPKIKSPTSFIPTSPSLKSSTSFIPSSPSLKTTSNSHIPSSPTISKYSTSTSSSLYNKSISHIASPRMGYSSPSSPTPYSKSYESRTYDPVATSYSIKDLISNKNPQILNHSNSIKSVSSISSSSTYKPSSGYGRKSSLEQNPQLKSYLNKMATSQRSKSPSMLSTASTSSSKYSSGRKTPNSRLGTHYSESTTSSTSSSSKLYSKYKTPSTSTSTSKIGTGISSYVDSEHKSKFSSSYGKSVSHSDIPTSSKISYSGRLSKTPTPSSYSKSSNESRIPSPSPYSKRSITPYY
ncbi:hypothetical protein PIROE2DRAFT_5166 [Piromyces sp. E2]|nr:hypothetical protein PIROE2DRAFT_5166 [Piromyces sp. E2]|eukprot:OUM67416.1 hypothetical protein PIROE2DRAFT_5166 [Piromyces sp. E2]